MIQFPLRFETAVIAACGMQTRWEVHSQQHQSRCAVPTEFEGPGGAFSPEDFFAQALTNCFVATFQVVAEKSRVTFEKVEVRGELVVDRNEEKRPCMKSFMLKIRVVGPSDPQRVSTLVTKSIDSGFILNSVKTSIRYELETA